MVSLNRYKVFLRRSVDLSLAKLRPLVVMIALGIAVFLFTDSIVGAGISSYSKNITTNSALNHVEVSSVGPETGREISEESLIQFESLDRVVEATGWAQLDFSIEQPDLWPSENNPGAFFGTPFISGVTPAVVVGDGSRLGPGPGEVLLPQTALNNSYDDLLGKEVEFVFTKETGPGTGVPAPVTLEVVGLFDNTTPGLDGAQAAYLNAENLTEIITSAKPAGTKIAFPRAFIRTATSDDVVDVQSQVLEQGYSVTSVATQIRSLSGLFALLALASWVIGAVLVVFCVGIGISVGGSWMKQRSREVGLLKAIGWQGGNIAKIYMVELAIVGLIIGLVGVIIGSTGSLIGTTVISGLHLEFLPISAWELPKPGLMIGAILCVPLFLCLGSIFHVLKLSRVDADSSLRDL